MLHSRVCYPYVISQHFLLTISLSKLLKILIFIACDVIKKV